MKCYVHELNPDIIMITETWAKEEINDAELKLEDYEIFRNDRKHAKGGGCLIYCKSSINAVPCTELTNTENTETVWYKIKCIDSQLLVGVCYLSPSASDEEEKALHDLITSVCENRNDVLICGDFNHRTIDWDRLHSQAEGRKFLDLTLDNFLVQHVKEPTRGENILDLVLTSDENMVECLQVREPFGTSDHNVITFELICSVEMQNWKQEYYDYRHGDYKGMCKYLKDVRWDTLLEGIEVNEMWDVFRETLNEAVSLFVPKKVRKKNNKPLWWNRRVQRARKNKLMLWQRYQDSKTYQDYITYKRALNKATKQVRKAKKKYERKLTKNIKKDPKAFYKYARSKMNVKDRVGPLSDEDGETVTDDSKASEMLNNFFSSVFTQEIIDNLPEPRKIFQGNVGDELNRIELSPEIVLKKLMNLKPDKAPGVDSIYPIVLKEVSGAISQPLSKIFQKSLCNTVVPGDWRSANVTPIFKKGQRSRPENYRPVSLTSVISKVFETILRDAIVDHLKRHKLVKDSQHGFSKGRSCLTNLLIFLEKVTKYVDDGFPVDILYLDFSKAFDKVPHQRLLLKLRAHGVGAIVTDWIGAWLKDRKQRVVVNGKESNWSPVCSGVPQGSVLGPTLFIIYINDIDDGITSEVLKFADDTKVFRKVATVEQAFTLQEDMHKLFYWSKEWQMMFNSAKCKCLHMGYGNPKYDYFIDTDPIESVSEEKDLGIIMHDSLDPSQQVAKVVKTANQVLGMIRRTYEDKSKENIVGLYKSLVRPHLEYCVQAWRPYWQKDIDNIEKVQRRATKLIPELKDMVYEDRLKETKLISLEMRRLRADLLEVFKIVHGFEDVNPENFFVFQSETGRQNTRGHSHKIYKQRSRLMVRKFFFSQRVIEEWNNLPGTATNATTINGFKSQLDPLLRRNGGLFISQRRLPGPVLKNTDEMYSFLV